MIGLDFFYFYYELFRVPGYLELLLVNFLTSGEEIIKLNIFTCQKLRRKQFIFLLFFFSLLNFCCSYLFWTLNSSHDHLYKYLQPKQSGGSWGSCSKTYGRIEKQLFQFYLISFFINISPLWLINSLMMKITQVTMKVTFYQKRTLNLWNIISFSIFSFGVMSGRSLGVTCFIGGWLSFL